MLQPDPTTLRDYTIVLEITPTEPLTHGMGNDGNEQLILTRPHNIASPYGWERIDIPTVSAASLRAKLREQAVFDLFERLHVDPAQVSRDALRLLLKGGKNDSGGQSVSLAAAREMRDLYPALSVWGSMDGGLPIKGKLEVSDVNPYCVELVDAGHVPSQITPLQVTIDGSGPARAAIPIFEGRPPIPAHMIRGHQTNYRHDMLSSSLAQMIAPADRAQIEDKRAAVAAKKDTKGAAKPNKEERREANESMPYSMQTIVAGTPMVCVLRLNAATAIEFTTLCVALARWRAGGAHLGGGGGAGRGACSVKFAGAIASALSGVPVREGDVVRTEPEALGAGEYDAYVRHIDERADKIRAHLAESTR